MTGPGWGMLILVVAIMATVGFSLHQMLDDEIEPDSDAWNDVLPHDVPGE
jgi:hypothetical protein